MGLFHDLTSCVAVTAAALLLFCSAVTTSAQSTAGSYGMTVSSLATQSRTVPRIVQGSLTSGFPAVGALLVGDLTTGVGDGSQATPGCTGTLIGCNMFITAAHCVCGADFSTGGCAAGANPPEARLFGAFFPHAGFYNATSVAVDPDYDINASIGDIAIVHLAGPVTGIQPAMLADRSPQPGEMGTIVGYGLTAEDASDSGVKRVGSVTLSDCNDGTNGEVLCWSFDGSQSNTCIGDSGGPLFVTSTRGEVVAGIASSGLGCLPPAPGFAIRAWDSGVFTELDWIIAEAGTDLRGESCGGEPAVGDPEILVITSEGFIDEQNRWGTQSFIVPQGASRLRITTTTSANLKMLARPGVPLTNGSDESPCFEFGLSACKVYSFDDPQPGTWYVGEEQQGHSIGGGAWRAGGDQQRRTRPDYAIPPRAPCRRSCVLV